MREHVISYIIYTGTKNVSASCTCGDWKMTAEGPSSFELHKSIIELKFKEHVDGR